MLPENLFFPRQIDQRVAILGIGNELNGDDAAGVEAARSLNDALPKRGVQMDAPEISADSRIWVIDTGPSPESFTGPLRRFRPDLVLLIDAAELGEKPGTIRFFDWHAAQGMSGSTHTLPPSLLARFLMEETGCKVILIGIQPGQLEFGEPLSGEVNRAVAHLVNDLQEWLTRDR